MFVLVILRKEWSCFLRHISTCNCFFLLCLVCVELLDDLVGGLVSLRSKYDDERKPSERTTCLAIVPIELQEIKWNAKMSSNVFRFRDAVLEADFKFELNSFFIYFESADALTTNILLLLVPQTMSCWSLSWDLKMCMDSNLSPKPYYSSFW